MTAPLIGNTGVNEEDVESRKPFCSGFAVREASPLVSNWRAKQPFGDYLKEHGIPAIEGIDTRALTRAIRTGGAQRGGIFVGDLKVESLLEKVKASPSMEGSNWVPSVTCDKPYSWDQPSWVAEGEERTVASKTMRVAALDLGIKRNILCGLRDVGCDVRVFPAQTSVAELAAFEPDGYFLSNGPGDPAAVTDVVETVRALCDTGKPVFGICLGHQILSLALGAKTFKLPFGHHGGNHPVIDLGTGKVEITSQNHGFSVDDQSLPSGIEVTHRNLYDQTVEGFRVKDRPIFGIQYHPEASPGPHDAAYLFKRFADAMA